MTLQSCWHLLRLAGQFLNAVLQSSYHPSLLLNWYATGNMELQEIYKIMYLHQCAQAEIVKYIVGNSLCGPILLCKDKAALPLTVLDAKSKPYPFYSCRWMQCLLKTYLNYSCFSLLILQAPFTFFTVTLCVVRKYILAQIYTGTDIKALTHEAQCCFFCITIKDPDLFSVCLLGEKKIWRVELLGCLPKMWLILLRSVSRSSASDIIILWSLSP